MKPITYILELQTYGPRVPTCVSFKSLSLFQLLENAATTFQHIDSTRSAVQSYYHSDLCIWPNPNYDQNNLISSTSVADVLV